MSKENSEVLQPQTSSAQQESAPIRGEMVDAAVRFFSTPKIQQSPMAEQLAFLRSKGVTDAEINEALRKVPPVPRDVAPMAPGFQVPPPHPAPGTLQNLMTLANAAVIIGGVSYAGYKALRSWVLPKFFGIPDPGTEEARREQQQLLEVQNSLKFVMDTMNQEQQLNESFRSEIRKSVVLPNSGRECDLRTIQSDLNTLKSLMLNQNQFAAIPIPPKPSVPAWQRSEPSVPVRVSQFERFSTPPSEENRNEANGKEESDDEEVATALNKNSENRLMSSIGTTEESTSDWLEIDDSISVPPQSIDEILADEIVDFDDDAAPFDDNSSQKTASVQILPAPPSYQLDCAILIERLEPTSAYLTAQNIHCTALAVSSQLVAVGTSAGIVLVFNRLSGKVLNSVRGDDHGESVSCLAFSSDAQRIAVGTSKGLVRILGSLSGKVYEKACEAVQPGRGVIQLDFALRNRRLLTLDNGGSVFEYRSSGSKVRCVFSGSNGEVVRMRVIKDELVALMSLTKVVVLAVHKTQVVFATQYSGSPKCPPLFEWSAMQNSSDSIVAALARGSEVSFFHLSRRERGSFAAYCARTVRIPGDVINLKFLDENELLVLDSAECAFLVDVQRGTLVDSREAASAQMVYGSAFFKGLSTGGNVSEAMVHLSDRVCYQSVAHFDGNIYVLGRSQVSVVQIGDHLSQLEAFESRGEIVSAVLYALDVFSGKVSSRRNRSETRRSISERFPRIIQALLDKTMRVDQGFAEELYNHYKKHISILMRACVNTNHYDLLYKAILPKVEEDPIARSVFYESMDDVIQESALQHPPPALVHDYIAHLAQENQLAQIEFAVMHLPMESLDIHQIMTICNRNNLYDAIIFVNNAVFKLFVPPLEQMLASVAEFCQKEVLSDCEVAQGNKMLVYISVCLTGRAYPFGVLSPQDQETVPMEIYRCLTSSGGKEGRIGGNYPNLRILLQFDAQQFFHVVLTCADSTVLSSNERLQHLVEILHSLVKDLGRRSPIIFGHFLSFLGWLLEKAYVFPNVHMIGDLIDSVFSSEYALGCSKDSSEQCIIDVMNYVDGLDLDHILRMALKLPHVQVAAFIYTQKNEYNKLVQCYLRNRMNPQAVFSVVTELLRKIAPEYLESFRTYIKSIILELCALDSYRTAELVLDRFPEVLEHQKNLPYDLLNNCFKIRRENDLHYLTGNDALDEKLFNAIFQGHLQRHEVGEAEGGLREKYDVKLNDEIHFWLPLGSASDFCLNLAVGHKLLRCSVTLLRARQLPDRAFELLFENLCEIEDDKAAVVTRIDDILALCNDLQSEALEGNWLLKLFQHILSFEDIASDTELSARANAIILSIVESGSGEAENLVRTLFEHKSFVNCQYSRFSSLISSVLDSCQYEEILLEATLKCQEFELSRSVEQWTEQMQRGVFSVTDQCIVCQEPPSKTSNLFQCGHMVHVDCLHGDRFCPCQKTTLPLQPCNVMPFSAPAPYKKKRKEITLFTPAMGSLELAPSVPGCHY
ncbi:hypothetical protein QR680_005599 [Steinernema hermaphroditum]|uniref:RING-type domain-containing protein n=1 Tax=Steinernema hermaphroditum TaxID=289476 RepID=A0AA39LVN0_9BILA|nr:hypothetical protein QR680_005599 [Steinernema hermaphroditum]